MTLLVSSLQASGSVDFCGTINAGDGWLREVLVSYGVQASEDTLHESKQVMGVIHSDFGHPSVVTDTLHHQTPTGRAVIQVSTSTADNSIILVPGKLDRFMFSSLFRVQINSRNLILVG